MAETYARRQLLLRREDSAPAGFARFERVGGRVTVTVRAQGVGREARAVLLQPGGEVKSLGALLNGEAQYTLLFEEAEGYTQAAVLSADRLLLLGGEGEGFVAVRKRLAGRGAKAGEGRAPFREQGARSPKEGERTAEGGLRPYGEESRPREQPAQPTAERARREEEKAPAPTDGWVITPTYTPGAPERIHGRLFRDGAVVARLDGVAGVYAPEPPPGLTGYSWDAGFWVHVEAAEG